MKFGIQIGLARFHYTSSCYTPFVFHCLLEAHLLEKKPSGNLEIFHSLAKGTVFGCYRFVNFTSH